MAKTEIRAYIGLVAMTIIIGLSFIFVKLALNHANPVDILAQRFLIASLTISLYYVLIKRKKPKIGKKDFFPLLLLSLFYPVFLFLFQTLGLQYTSASEAGILSAIAPIITVVLAFLILKEKTNKWQVVSIFLSVLGVIYIIYKNGVGTITAETLKGDILILLSVVSMAFYFVLGRLMNRRLNALDITLFMSITAAIVFNLYAYYSHAEQGSVSNYFAAYSSQTFLWAILYLGVLSTVVSSLLTNFALKVIPASQVSIFNNMSPIITVFAGIIFLNESLYYYHIVGGLMVMLGIVGVNVLRSKSVK